MQLDKAIQNRHSVRKFKMQAPDWRDIIEAIDSARYAPIAGNNFTLRFIVVSEKHLISELARCCQQEFINEAKYVVVACSKPGRLISSFGHAGKIYARQQAGAGIQNFLLSLTQKNLSTCWIGFFVERDIKQLLHIPDDVDVEAVFPIGYEFHKPMTRKHKIDLDGILLFNDYKNKKMKKPRKINV